MQRRKFIKIAGGVSAVASTPGLVQATSQEEDMRSNGISGEIKKLLHEGNIEKAHKILDAYGINYSHSSFEGPDTRPRKITPDYAPNPEGGPNYEFGVYDEANNSDELYMFHYWKFIGDGPIDGPGPDDGAAITYSENALRTLHDTVDKKAYPPCEITGENTTHHGYRVDFDDHGTATREGWMEVSAKVRDDYTSEAVTVYADYVHSWNPGGLPQNLSISFSIAGAGSLTFDVTGHADTWRAEDEVEHSV